MQKETSNHNMQVMCTSTFDTEGSHEVLLKSGKAPPKIRVNNSGQHLSGTPALFFWGGGGGGELSYF